MTIRFKILLACLSLTAVTVLLGIYSQNAQQNLGRVATGLYDNTVLAISYLRSAQNTMAREEVAWRRGDGSAGIDLHTAIAKALPDITTDLDVARDRAASPEGRNAIDNIRRSLESFVSQPGIKSEDTSASQLEQIDMDFAVAVEIYAGDGYQDRRNANQMLEAMARRTWEAIALSVAVAALITFLLSRSIVPAIRSALAFAEAISRGELDNRIEAHGRDESADLLRMLKTMQSSIAAALDRIRALLAQQADSHAGEMAAHRDRMAAALGNMNQGLCLFDGNGLLAIHNQRFEAMFGAPPPSATAEQIRRLIGLDTHLSQPGSDDAVSAVCDLKDGRAVSASQRPVAGGGWVCTYEDITDRRAAEMRLAHMARHDLLTGLPNRMMMSEHMPQALARARRGDGLAVLCLDLDRFKAVNDTFGHSVGDALLRQVAERLRNCVRESDLIIRLGGDEFAILQEDARLPLDATALARRLIAVIGEPFDINGQEAVIGTSVGIAMSLDGQSTADELLKRADLALYRAKEDGRGSFRFFEAEMDARMQLRRSLELDLRRAFSNEEFEVFYQPQVVAADGRIAGFEALLRWHHPQRGLVSPAEFIPIAEEIGMIGPIGAWVMSRACMDAMSWPGDLSVAVNLSPEQFRGRNLSEDTAHALAASGLPGSRLELEITEAVLMQEDDSVLQTLHALRAQGIRIAMDDFGTGYSSLSYLRRFPFDKIKIDQSFVRGMAEHEDCHAIVHAVIGLGRSLGIAVNAEGVETQEQLDALRQEGCFEVQGFLFSRPQPGSMVVEMLSSQPHSEHFIDTAVRAAEEAA